jgi:hypothetical protein
MGLRRPSAREAALNSHRQPPCPPGSPHGRQESHPRPPRLQQSPTPSRQRPRPQPADPPRPRFLKTRTRQSRRQWGCGCAIQG